MYRSSLSINLLKAILVAPVSALIQEEIAFSLKNQSAYLICAIKTKETYVGMDLEYIWGRTKYTKAGSGIIH